MKLFKKILFCVCFLVTATFMFAQNSKFSGKSILVNEPELKFASEEDAVIPILVQGLFSSNFQNYSNMKVIDRQNLDKIKKEQKISETASFSEENQIKTGELLAAKYIVVSQIIKTGTVFSLDCKITDTESGVSEASYMLQNISQQDLLYGTAVNEVSRQLLLKIGVQDSKLANLIQKDNKKQNDIVEGNINIAKGIIAQRNDNIVEAMSYFQKQIGDSSIMTEAASRLNNLTQDLSSGNIRDYAKNEIAFRREWVKIWQQYGEYMENNAPYIVYSTDIERGKIDYKNETVEIKAKVAYGLNPECENLYNRLYGAYKNIDASHDVKNWGIRTSFDSKYQVEIILYDENKNSIGKSSFNVTPSKYNSDIAYNLSVRTVSFTCPVDSITDKLSIDVTSSKKGGIIYASK